MVKWYKYKHVGKGTIPGIRTYTVPSKKGTGLVKMKSKVTKGGWEYISISPKEYKKRRKMFR